MNHTPTNPPPSVAELKRYLVDFMGNVDGSAVTQAEANKAFNSLDQLCARAADPAPVADEAAIEAAMMKLANAARIAGSMGMWHQLNPGQPSEFADWEAKVHDRASELRNLLRARLPASDDAKLRKLKEQVRTHHDDTFSNRCHEEQEACSVLRMVCVQVENWIDQLLAEGPARNNLEQCHYCKGWFPQPVEYHHHENDCKTSYKEPGCPYC